MHELTVCRGLLKQVQHIADVHGASAVNEIRVQIGALSGVEPKLLQSAFPIASAGTICARAALIIEHIPVRVRCTLCGRDSDAQPNRLICAGCGSWRTRLCSGDELLLHSVALSMPDTSTFSEQSAVHV